MTLRFTFDPELDSKVLKSYFAGIKSSGKVVYFSATFPYLLLITLMIYALLQDGAIDGVKTLFIVTKWHGEGSVLDFNVWRQAAGQMFFSLSISWGGLFMFGK